MMEKYCQIHGFVHFTDIGKNIKKICPNKCKKHACRFGYNIVFLTLHCSAQGMSEFRPSFETDETILLLSLLGQFVSTSIRLVKLDSLDTWARYLFAS